MDVSPNFKTHFDTQLPALPDETLPRNGQKIGNGDIVLTKNHSAICFADDMCQLKADFMHALKSLLGRHFWRLKVLYEMVAEL